MKFSYKEKQDLIWSLEQNAKRLENLARNALKQEAIAKYEKYDTGARWAREEYTEVMNSFDRIKDLITRIQNESY